MKFIAASILALATGTSAFAPANQGRVMSTLQMSDAAPANPGYAVFPDDTAPMVDLKSLSEELNPVVGYFDPLKLAQADFYNMGQDATVGFLRHAEIKHGRVAMAAFVGYCVQSNFHFPWAMSLDGSDFPSIDLAPEAQWDAIPANAKWQILAVIGALELWDEASGRSGAEPHYMNGRTPGKYPSFDLFRDNVHWVLDLYDPFGFSKKTSQEVKDRRLVIEINNGRAAMLGIFGFICADTVEGSVPLLNGIAIPYSGQVMSPFEAGY